MAHRRHFAILDGLRGIGALVIVVFHIAIPFGLGSIVLHTAPAVEYFFCLSGFVIGYAYEQKLLGTMTFGSFAVARLMRLYPLIVFGSLLGLAVYIIKAHMVGVSPFSVTAMTAFVLELLMIPNPLQVGLDWTENQPFNPPAWTLFFEFVAYFLYAALVRYLTKSVLVTLMAVGAAIVVAQSYVLGGVEGGNYWSTLPFGFGRMFFPFLCGLFLYRRWAENPTYGRASEFLGPALFAIFIFLRFYPMPAPWDWIYEALIVLIAYPVMINLGASGEPGPTATSVYLFMGRLSFPLYITHYPLVRVFSNYARSRNLADGQLWLLMAIELIFIIVFAYAVMKVFDQPVRAWLGQRWRDRKRSAEAV